MGYLRKMQVLLLMVLAGIMLLAVPTFAESVQVYDASVITGFEPGEYNDTVSTEYKYALIELRKEFPAQLTVQLGGEAAYQVNPDGSRVLTSVSGYSTQTLDVVWKCREDYDEDLDVFHFVPEFADYKIAAGLAIPEITVNVLGEITIPPANHFEPLEPRPIAVKEKTLEEKAALPTSYNNYERGVLPPIRNQGSYGSCWAHATMAAIEGDLIHDGNATTSIDLSELHLAYFSYHKFTDEKGLNTGDTITGNSGTNYLNNGGHDFLAANVLFNMVGPVKESAAPYSSAASYSPSASSGRTGDYKITGIYYYDIKYDRDSVKTAIMNHGAVTGHFLSDSSYYSSTYNSFYCPTETGTDHAIAIVGWDDNFSKNNFRSGTPEGNGAWLIRNSWGGSGYGWSGYFWMSYYDQSLHQYSYAYDVQPGGRYDHVYAYDNAPWHGWYSASDGLSQSFYVDGGESIQAIGYFTEESNLGLKFTVTAGSNSVTKTFTTGAPGYYLIPLSSPLTITSRTKVTVSCTITSGSLYAYVESSLSDWGDYGFTWTAAKGSDGMVVNGSTTNYDGKVRLFTNNASITPDPLAISQGNVLGYSTGILITTAYDKNATGYKITVYDIANKKTITPTIDKPVKSGSNVTINIHGNGLVNGNIYKLTVYKYNTTGGTTTKSNTVTVYGMPHSTIGNLTATPISDGVILVSGVKTGTDGTMYYVKDADTNKQVKKAALNGSTSTVKITELTNGKLYYSYTRPYRIYNNQYILGPKSKAVYYAPVAKPSGVNVQFSDATTVVISVKENSTARGVRVLYRELGGSLKNGCLSAGNQCSIMNLSQSNSYEFYVMHYNLINKVAHYGFGVAVQYTAPTVSTMTRPANAKIAVGNPTWTFTITKSSVAEGVSVLYRINEGKYQLCCEKKGTSCTKDLSTDQAYTFYIMQYKTENGKKVYSPGITVKNLYGSKSLDGLDLAAEFVETNEPVDIDEVNHILEEYNGGEDMLELDVQEFLEQEAQNEFPEGVEDIESEFDQLEEEDLDEPVPAEFVTASEDVDNFEPAEEDFIDVPMEGPSWDNTEQKGLETSAADAGFGFYSVDDGDVSDPYAPSFRNK